MNIYKVWIFYDSDFILWNDTTYGFLSQNHIKNYFKLIKL